MRKYLLNRTVLSSIASVLPAIKESRRAQTPLRIIATWAVLLGSVGLAVSGVNEEASKKRVKAVRKLEKKAKRQLD